ncbi:acetyltransferase [Psychrobacillus sp. NEAU-3TGS]|uniref:acetyltransferase n=1 Tax=Psychrobacillus sp. NEAU-3TGS TaxID=2995412 RepID=UPI0024964B14|nr:acetyltransferase [Psychrobacillus sp. NEAU-3TGS]MDI2589750.1 acetyltransferase [Psychrobacillus sp. NEAU-3TGS]
MVIGTGGNSIDIVEIIQEISELGNQKYEILGYLDDNEQLHNTVLNGYKVLGGLPIAKTFPEDIFFVFTIGSEKSYKKRGRIISDLGIGIDRFEKIIHPSARISKSASLGNGVIIFPNVFVGSNVKIGEFCIVLSNTVINHDCRLGSYNICASSVNLAGGVKVEDFCYLGAGASVRNSVEIKTGSLIGMGSVVLNSIAENAVIIGNPGRLLYKENK